MKQITLVSCLVVLAAVVSLCYAETAELEDLLNTGKLALDDKNYTLAEKKFKQYLKQGGEHPAQESLVKARLAECYHGQKNYSAVFDLLGSGEDGAPLLSPDGAFAYWRAMARYELQEFDKALAQTDFFTSGLADSPYQPRALRLRGWIFMKQGNLDAAIDQFSRFNSRYPDDADAPLNLLDYGRALIASDKIAGAEEVLQDLLTRFPDSRESLEGRYWLGQLLIQKSNWDEALKVLAVLGESTQAPATLRADAWFAVAEIKEAQQNLDGAVNALSRAIEASAGTPKQREGRLSLGQLLLRMNRIEEGVPLLKAVIADAPTAPSAPAVQLSLSYALLNSANYDKAVTEFQNYLESFTDPGGLASASQGKGWALYHLERYAEAATAFKKAADLYEDPIDKVEAHFKMGDSYFRNKQYSLAAETYDEIYKTYTNSPVRVQARYQLGVSRILLGERQEGEAVLQSMQQDHPGDEFSQRALLRLALLKKNDGDHEAAIKSFETVMQAYPDSPVFPEALLQHGLVQYSKPLYDYPRALKDFDRIVNDYANSEQVQTAEYMRGWCHYMMGRGSKALEVWKAYIATYGDDEDAAFVEFWIGEYLFNTQQNVEAEKHFLAIASSYPEHELADDSLFWAARAAFNLKEYLRANEHCTRFVKDYASSAKMPEVRFLQGQIAGERLERATAVLLFDEIIKKYPDHYMADQARIKKGLSHFLLGVEDHREYSKAILEYESVLNSKNASRDLKYMADFEIGRCLVELDRKDEAMERFYKIMAAFQKAQSEGVRHSLRGQEIFTIAAMRAAEMKRAEKQWQTVVSIYQRVVDAGVPGSDDARQKIDEIKSEHWILF